MKSKANNDETEDQGELGGVDGVAQLDNFFRAVGRPRRPEEFKITLHITGGSCQAGYIEGPSKKGWRDLGLSAKEQDQWVKACHTLARLCDSNRNPQTPDQAA